MFRNARRENQTDALNGSYGRVISSLLSYPTLQLTPSIVGVIR
jgi:hypothetical protein